MQGSLLVTLSAVVWLIGSSALAGETRLINGQPVEPGTWTEVVRITTGTSSCSATVVGPRVLVTAAHCAVNGATSKFKIGDKEYSAKITRSSLYPGKDHDIAIGLVDQDITGIEPASIGGKATTGLGITLLGYGCTNPGGGGGNDGVLRIGDTVVTGFSGFDMVSRKAGGAALCFGDSGGPAMLVEDGKHLLLGINSKGNIQDTNYNTRTDVPESVTFLTTFANQQSVQICGINKTCGGQPIEPKPTCTLAASPTLLTIGANVTLNVITQGAVTGVTIDGSAVSFPTGSKTFKPSATGTFTAHATVNGPGGSNSCAIGYEVEGTGPDPDPSTPNFAVVPAFCGDNTISDTPISRVCLGVVKKDSTMPDLKVSQVLVVTYRDTTKSVMPIVLKKTQPGSDGDIQIKEDLTMYANTSVNTGNYLVLDTRSAVVTKAPQRAGETPTAIQGRCAKGYYFLVDHLNPYSVSP